MAKSSEIIIRVNLNEENVPESIEWKASDHPDAKEFQTAKGMLISFFDQETKDTLKIDLWTEKMQVMEMDRFIFQTLKGLTNTYVRATNNHKLGSAMKQLTEYFGEETEILKKDPNKSDGE